MRVTEHIKILLENGHKPKELIELGFSKTTVTRVQRQLRKEKATSPTKAPAQPVEAEHSARGPVSTPGDVANIQQRLESVERIIHEIRERCEALETQGEELQELKDRLFGTPALGLKNRFTCSCGASGFVALLIKCTKCDREIWRGWFPD